MIHCILVLSILKKYQDYKKQVQATKKILRKKKCAGKYLTDILKRVQPFCSVIEKDRYSTAYGNSERVGLTIQRLQPKVIMIQNIQALITRA